MKKLIAIIIILLSAFLLYSCTRRVTKENLLEKIGETINELDSYSVDASMTVYSTNDEEIDYEVKVDYLKPDHYRVDLVNKMSNNKQIILKNSEGVYVLSPTLNKSFKFKSDWPTNTSSAYLYNLVIGSVFNDESAIISETDEGFSIESTINSELTAKYNKQRVSINKKSLLPSSVVMFDDQLNPVVNVVFNKFEKNVKLKKKDFDKKDVMTTSILELGDTEVSFEDRQFLVPTFSPDNTEKEHEEEEKDTSFLVSYTGDVNYTIVEKMIEVGHIEQVTSLKGIPVLLDETVAALSPNSLTFVKNGVEISIYSEDLTAESMLEIANSFNYEVN